MQVLIWILDEVKKSSNCTLYSKVLQGRGTSVFNFQDVISVSPQKIFSPFFYWIPITFTMGLYQNKLLISRNENGDST